MKTLFVACLLVGAFLLGAYADHRGDGMPGAPGGIDWHGLQNYWTSGQSDIAYTDGRGYNYADRLGTPDWHEYRNYWSWNDPSLSVPIRDVPQPVADQGAAPGSHLTAQNCVPALQRSGMNHARALAACDRLMADIAR